MEHGKDYSFTGYRKNHKQAARNLRRDMTPEERKLWYAYLRATPFTVYRQRPIDQFIVDFYIPCAKLIIEVDGAPHFTKDGRLYDKIRTDILEKYQLQVLRFTNAQIMDHFQQVCESISRNVIQMTNFKELKEAHAFAGN